MVIKKLVIKNFRSYYGEKIFVFDDGLNLILGANGDGKTTFFEALNWVLSYRTDVDETLPQNESLVSAKFFKELEKGKKGEVSVSLEVLNNDSRRREIVRTLIIRKTEDESMQIFDSSHLAFLLATSGKRTQMSSLKELFERENVFPSMAKKYSVFKGEDELNIFDDKQTLQNLIDLYSDIKDMEPYKVYAEYAVNEYRKVVKRFQDNNSAKSRKQAQLQNDIESIKRLIEQKEGQLEVLQDEYDDLCGALDAITEDMDLLTKVNEMRQEVNRLTKVEENLRSQLNENYSLQMLDNLWILMGFQPFIDEYTEKMSAFSELRKETEREYIRQQTINEVREDVKAEAIEEVKKELEVLPLNKNEESLIKQMMNAHRCSICGTDAPEGSAAYEFMKNRLQRAMDQLAAMQLKKNEEAKAVHKQVIPELYVVNNTDNSLLMSTLVRQNNIKIGNMEYYMNKQMTANQNIHEDIDRTVAKIETLEADIAQALAQSKGDMSEYLENFNAINHKYRKKESTAIEIEELKNRTIPSLREQLEQKNLEYKKSVESAKGSECIGILEYLENFAQAVANTEKQTYFEFLNNLAKRANDYLNVLNVDDFTGVIKIDRKQRSNREELTISLEDRNGKIITNPNTSLATTMHISLLLAISEVSKESGKGEYPLIFDAPTSSFDEGKDRGFYECLNTQVDKQCIVVTKSFLYKNDDTGEYEEDKNALRKLNCPVYRIKKLTGFDKQDITTIDTQVKTLQLS